jgi:hypothetical protein
MSRVILRGLDEEIESQVMLIVARVNFAEEGCQVGIFVDVRWSSGSP